MWSNVIVESNENEGLPPARWKHSIVLDNNNNNLYLYGGKAGTVQFKDFWKLELRGGKWKKIENSINSPPALHEHSIVYYNNYLYMFGGECSLNNTTPLWIYSINENSWRKWETKKNSSKSPLGRRAHVGLVYSGYMLIYGGYRDLIGSLGDLWAFHFETESWHLLYKYTEPAWYNNLPLSRHNHAGIIHNGLFYTFAGNNNLIELNDFWKFDITNRSWIQIKTKSIIPGSLRSHSFTKALGFLFLIGGIKNGKLINYNELWKFSFESELWEKIIIHGLKPKPKYFPSILMLPAIIQIKNKIINNETIDGNGISHSTLDESSYNNSNNYWWDYTSSNSNGLESIKTSILLRKNTTNNYQSLSQDDNDETSCIDEGHDEFKFEQKYGQYYNNGTAEQSSSSGTTKKRSESINCFGGGGGGNNENTTIMRASAVVVASSSSSSSAGATTTGPQLQQQRVQKSNSVVRFTDYKIQQQISNSTSDYSSMENLDLIDIKRNYSFINPNYNTSTTTSRLIGNETIEMKSMLQEEPEEDAEQQRHRLRQSNNSYEITTPNYLLIIGGFDSLDSYIFNKELSIWRLRIGSELI